MFEYYKYCEEEWEFFDTFEEISADMQKYLDENDEAFSNPETFEYTEAFDEHCDKMIDSCINALVCLRQSMDEKQSDILLSFNLREYLDEEERVDIFKKLNPKKAAQEYEEHVEDFA